MRFHPTDSGPASLPAVICSLKGAWSCHAPFEGLLFTFKKTKFESIFLVLPGSVGDRPLWVRRGQRTLCCWALRAWLCLLNTSKIRQLYKQDQGPGQLPRVVTVLGTEAGQAHVGTLRESRQAGEVGRRPPRSPLPGCPDALKEALGGTNLRQFISEDSIHSGHKC